MIAQRWLDQGPVVVTAPDTLLPLLDAYQFETGDRSLGVASDVLSFMMTAKSDPLCLVSIAYQGSMPVGYLLATAGINTRGIREGILWQAYGPNIGKEGQVWLGQSLIQWMLMNRIEKVTMTSPHGTQAWRKLTGLPWRQERVHSAIYVEAHEG